ncbi:MAG: hypothetical protein CSA31_01630 [Desulfobulbus propionicus]|nr:MAG: hypothetical protein CSA31_01630 [Desulfobulbus propionicus]
MQLEKLEGVIKRDFAAFYRVGRALAEINERCLYRNENGRTFEQYCRELWKLSGSRSYELINVQMYMINYSHKISPQLRRKKAHPVCFLLTKRKFAPWQSLEKTQARWGQFGGKRWKPPPKVR